MDVKFVVKKKKAMAKTAWIIYWQVMGVSSIANIEDGQVIAVLSSRMGEEKATAALELLYKQAAYSLEEQIRWRQQGEGPYKVENHMRIHKIPVGGLSYSIGHNPMLTLRKVEKLKQTGNTISWIEKSAIHPAWFCRDRGYPDCEYAGLPAKEQLKTYEVSTNDYRDSLLH